ncbi:MAG TPA: MraY family glycosyltransferase [Candidatus Binatia bacterium]|nr:MraY family glycosyltransferase [Candidatus Binatia bacterium]
MRTYILILFTSSALSYIATLWVELLAEERGWARREGDGKTGRGAPRLGGLAVLTAILLTLGIVLLRQNMVSERIVHAGTRGLALLAACLAVFTVGVYDDVRGARPWQKLAVQFVAAGILFMGGFRVELLSNPFTHESFSLGWLGLPLTVLWLVAMSNAFNLIDGLDGLAAGTGLFASIALFLLAAMGTSVFVAAVSAAIAGAMLGFLPHNFHPARIYLGDSGSLTAGLALAALSIVSAQKGPVMVTLAIPLLIFGLPLLEVTVTTLRRLLSGHPLFRRDEEHLHHRLIKIGLAKRLAVFVLYGLAGLFALSSILLVNYSGSVAPLIALICGVLAWIVVAQMRYPEFTELDAHIRRALRTQPAVLRNQIAIRKTAAEFEQAASPDQAWACLSRLLDQLGFTEASCELHAADTAIVSRFDWCRSALSESGSKGASVPGRPWLAGLWTVEIPIEVPGGDRGLVRLGRAFDRRAPLFRMESLVELIAKKLAPALCLEPSRRTQPAPQPAPPPLAAAWKAAAGARR